MPQASQILSNLGLEATLLPLLEMHLERGCCSGLSDTAQQVAKKWFPGQVCCPNTQVSKGRRNARGCRAFHPGTATLHSRISSAPPGANIVSITAAFLKRGVREKGKNMREEQVRQRRAHAKRQELKVVAVNACVRGARHLQPWQSRQASSSSSRENGREQSRTLPPGSPGRLLINMLVLRS